MWFFGLLVWMMLPFFFLAFALRRWQWRRWAMIAPGGAPPYGLRHGRPWTGNGSAPDQQQTVESQQALIDALETRLSELEERLDFTERLLQGRK